MSSEHGPRLALVWPDAPLVATQGLGHRRVLRAPAVLETVVGAVREGLRPPASDLVREVERWLDGRA